MLFAFGKKKIIGTLVPLSALSSSKLSLEDQGTFATGVEFLDWLKKTNQSAWQFLPLHQTQLEKGSKTKRVPSPYKGYGIGFDPKYLPAFYKELIPTEKELKNFLNISRDWIEDYALFCALSEKFDTDDWRQWEPDLRNRKKNALDKWSKELENQIHYHALMQWRLHRSYEDIRSKAKNLGIVLIGDLPFYLSINSPLVWANQDVFQLEKDGAMKRVSGVPYGANSHFGRQAWGHPLYNWNSENGVDKILRFWKLRLSYMATIFDCIRIDHIIAFYRYGAIDPKNKFNDEYIEGPGSAVLKKVIDTGRDLGLAIYVEDSGKNVKEVQEFLAKHNLPGIKIFRFALNEKTKMIIDKYANINSYPKNSVAYTATHDTECLVLYLHMLSGGEKQKLAKAAGVAYLENDLEFAKILRNAVISSPSQTIIIPIQDWLLTTDRINIPGTEKEKGDENWSYKVGIPIEKFPLI